MFHLLPGATVMPVDELSQCRGGSPSAVPLCCYGLHQKYNIFASEMQPLCIRTAIFLLQIGWTHRAALPECGFLVTRWSRQACKAGHDDDCVESENICCGIGINLPEASVIKYTLCECMQNVIDLLLCNGQTDRGEMHNPSSMLSVSTTGPACKVQDVYMGSAVTMMTVAFYLALPIASVALAGGKLDWCQLCMASMGPRCVCSMM